jgi:uncharacterized protein
MAVQRLTQPAAVTVQPMIAFFKITALILLGLYIAICALLYAKQRSFIYHPQPSLALAVPSIMLANEGQQLQVSVRAALEMKSAQAVIYLGGNAEDVSQTLPLLELAFPQAAIYALHYRSFGRSSGQPSEAALVSDALALHAQVRQQHSAVTLIGRSLGSGVAVQLAASPVAKPTLRQLILVTPYSSLAEIAANNFSWAPVNWLLKDRFDSVQHAAQIAAPTLIIQAEHDQVIPAWSTQRLAQAVPPQWRKQAMVQGADHNNIGARQEYVQLLAGR